MNRTIKFRAWDSQVERMLSLEDMPNLQTNFDESGTLVVGYTDDCSDWHQLDLLQYTGLKDKNGKEIYEDDILEDEEADRYKVKYTSSGRFVADLHGEKGFVYDEFALDDGHWLIIGNIYENSELLTNPNIK